LDVQLAPVAPRETYPALALAAAIIGLGLLPFGLSYLSETSLTALALQSMGVS
jgi:NAD(P)H-quinone oxidoreductase subunit 4